ncbi:transglycosylase domain-containing protein [Chengkuizengella axinellae]|uniref:Transglycosylase domain-containing protein n=1 Tax=Chengkuizengella axinellae TaxID=3064388 RepID=A0ABT9IVF5_9BACL|nr:transglycosylase domain-containing protein [Chengkuizengella sp. 2205SS18-9]MDP5273322.1 transglycosylase domain-containing protein [Chengkuizengella sp. 2205SS18-9]
MSKEQKNKKDKSKTILKKSLIISLLTLKWILITGIIFGILTGGVVLGYVTSIVKDEPVRTSEEMVAEVMENNVSGFAYFNDETLIGQLRSSEDRRMIELNDIPQVIQDAFIATEDQNFESHIGIDIKGITRAVKQQVFNETIQTGGSTITQQLARRVFLNFDQTIDRKVKEIILSVRMEQVLTKDQILEAYLNKIGFGTGSSGYPVSGVKAAVQGIFGLEDLEQINIAQAAFLAGLPQNPNKYSPFTGYGEFDEVGFNAAIERQRHVLNRMVDANKITQEEYEEAFSFDLKASLAEPTEKAYTTYPYLMIEIERRAAEVLIKQESPDLSQEELAVLVEEYREKIINGGYKIYTTIDQTIYDAMQEIAQNPENFVPDNENGVEQTGAVMIDNKTGAILGMIEGRGYEIEEYNHATQMTRQPGSAMKPVGAYLPAIESGDIQPASILDDIPLILPDWSKGAHLPQNWDNKYHGLMTAREALNESYNIPAIYIYRDVVGIDNALDFVEQLGITTLTEEDRNAQTGVIGGLAYGTTVEEMTNAYSSIANYGEFNDAFLIEKIVDKHGNIEYEHQSAPERLFSEQAAFLVTDMLRTAVSEGASGSEIRNGFQNYGNIPIVGKTGTTNFSRDVWFLGYSPDVTLGVWAGYDQNGSLYFGYGHELNGTGRAKEIWAKVMDKTIELKPELFATPEFYQPEGLVRKTVSSKSGLIPSELTKQAGFTTTDWFDTKYVPTQMDDSLSESPIISYNDINYIPLASTPEDMIESKIVVNRSTSLKELYEDIDTILKGYASSQTPKKSNGYPMRLEDFYPQDMDSTAPITEDPRVDDGEDPKKPINVRLEQKDGINVITFDHSPSEDVVGYRFFRNNGTGYTFAKTIRYDDELKAIDYVSASNDYFYYVVAVDVAGNISEPAEVKSNNETEAPEIPNEEENNDDENTGDTEGNNEDSEPETNPGNIGFLPTVPTNVTAVKDDLTVKITWSSNSINDKVLYYEIFYSEEEDGEYQFLDKANKNSYANISLIEDGWYKISAVNKTGASALSEPVEVIVE